MKDDSRHKRPREPVDSVKIPRLPSEGSKAVLNNLRKVTKVSTAVREILSRTEQETPQEYGSIGTLVELLSELIKISPYTRHILLGGRELSKFAIGPPMFTSDVGKLGVCRSTMEKEIYQRIRPPSDIGWVWAKTQPISEGGLIR